jgi:hypothetical protein
MSHQGHNCPFLNRSDSRCGGYFSLERMRHAFQHCMDDYHTCPLYAELLVERRLKRVASHEAKVGLKHAAPAPVQVTVTRRIQQPMSGAA